MVDTGGTETILLVEDEVAVRQLMERTLARLGYCVLAAGSGSEAVRVAESSDRHMICPDRCRHARDERARARATDRCAAPGHPRAVLFRVFPMASGSKAAFSPNVAFLPKPFTPKVLARKVRECLASRVSGPAVFPRERAIIPTHNGKH